MDILHQPVLLQETLESIPPQATYIVDGTLWHGGHSLAILQHFQEQKHPITLIGLDVDEHILHKAQQRLQPYHNTKLLHASYADIDKIVQQENIPGIDFVLLDLWVNMEHFKDAKRGFSTHNDAKLDMRFDDKQPLSAYEFINQASPQDITKAFINYADFTEAKAEEISKKIFWERKKKPITTTYDLKNIIKSCAVGEKACTLLFQAIRIQINHEMDNLNSFLQKIPTLLRPWGRCAIMSYHSIEDRITKLAFKELKNHWFKLVNKKTIQAHYTEVQRNRASRSAKLRIIEKL